jgi:hypothetical protein
LWQTTKRKTDPDYHQNQAQAQSNWRSSNPDYWRRYRETHPDYTAANRQQQKQRNSRRRSSPHELLIANSDTSSNGLPSSGIFKLVAIDPATWAGQHEWVVQITQMAPA